MNDETKNLAPYERLSLEIGTFIADKNPDPNVALQALELALTSIAVSMGAYKSEVMENVSTLFDACSGADETLQILDRLKKH